VSVVHKDGLVDLHSLGFPEVNEELFFRFATDGRVLKAGDYSATSVFYVPPLSLPPRAVTVGESWELNHAWVSKENGIPLGLEIVTILKQVVQCGSDLCADLEISGSVKIDAPTSKDLDFISDVRGRMLFSIDRGVIVWSLVNNRERLTTKESVLKVKGCMVARLNSPLIWREHSRKNIACKTEPLIPVLPGE
jgi:hypothetical protein